MTIDCERAGEPFGCDKAEVVCRAVIFGEFTELTSHNKGDGQIGSWAAILSLIASPVQEGVALKFHSHILKGFDCNSVSEAVAEPGREERICSLIADAGHDKPSVKLRFEMSEVARQIDD